MESVMIAQYFVCGTLVWAIMNALELYGVRDVTSEYLLGTIVVCSLMLTIDYDSPYTVNPKGRRMVYYLYVVGSLGVLLCIWPAHITRSLWFVNEVIFEFQIFAFL